MGDPVAEANRSILGVAVICYAGYSFYKQLVTAWGDRSLRCNGSRTFLSAGAVALPTGVAPSVPVGMARSSAGPLSVGGKRDREFRNGDGQLLDDGLHLLDD